MQRSTPSDSLVTAHYCIHEYIPQAADKEFYVNHDGSNIYNSYLSLTKKMAGFYPNGHRAAEDGMDQEMLGQYYGYHQMGSAHVVPQYSTMIPGSTGFIPAGPAATAGYQAQSSERYYQTPYPDVLPPHSAAPMSGNHHHPHHHQSLSSPPSYHGYMGQPSIPRNNSLSMPGGADIYQQQQRYHANTLPRNTALQPPTSPSDTSGDLEEYGIQEPDGTWQCRYPGCSSKSFFTRACDLRKHFNRHNKNLFCRYEGCPQATEGGFSSKKDRARHEAKHNPDIRCEWEDCDRVFSRMDNMKDHVRRIHYKGSR